MNQQVYDYVIVGAGPVGITLAWGLARHTNAKILLLDREDSIGGCHRVRRVESGLFTEHGPRIYVTNYFVLQQLMSEMGMSWSDYFTDYAEMGMVFGDVELGISDYLKFVPEFLWMMIDDSRARGLTVESWAKSVGMSRKTIDFLDRICRLTDGAGADRYTLFEFMQLPNQNALYSIQQPRRPLDVGLWSVVHSKLDEAGVDIQLGASVESLIDGGESVGGHPVGVRVNRGGKMTSILGKRIIMAVPPEHLVSVLGKSGPQLRHSFGNYSDLVSWERDVRYMTYIPITYHWKKKLDLPATWGYPRSSWGIAFIPLHEYMDRGFSGVGSDNGSNDFGGMQTVMTICISKVDTVSPVTGLTANQTQDVNGLMTEALRQLRESYPELDDMPDRMVLSPGVQRSVDGLRWETKDSAFMLTKHGYASDLSESGGRVSIRNGFQSPRYLNLYWCGVQNGQGAYHFTAMESAMGNAVKLLHKLAPKSQWVYAVQKPWTLEHLVYFGLAFLVLVLQWFGWI